MDFLYWRIALLWGSSVLCLKCLHQFLYRAEITLIKAFMFIRASVGWSVCKTFASGERVKISLVR